MSSFRIWFCASRAGIRCSNHFLGGCNRVSSSLDQTEMGNTYCTLSSRLYKLLGRAHFFATSLKHFTALSTIYNIHLDPAAQTEQTSLGFCMDAVVHPSRSDCGSGVFISFVNIFVFHLFRLIKFILVYDCSLSLSRLFWGIKMPFLSPVKKAT